MTTTDRQPPRGYDCSGRRAAGQIKRLATLDACRELLLRDGYRATSIQEIGRAHV